jgi:putative ABC transport system permease protein
MSIADWLSAFRYAFRSLRRQPTFVLISVLTLSLGIGANTALFSIIRAVVLNPLPYEDPEKIVVLWEVNPVPSIACHAAFEDWKADAGPRSVRRNGGS